MNSLRFGGFAVLTIYQLLVSFNQQSISCYAELVGDDDYDSFFVDYQNGRDGWNGRFAIHGGGNRGPFKNLKAAVRKIRIIRQGNLDRKARVHLLGGYHRLFSPVLLDNRDSGLSFIGYPGSETPIISGGNKIPGSSFTQTPNEPSVWEAPYTGSCSKHAFLGNKKRLVRARKPNLSQWTGKDMSGQGPYLYIEGLLRSIEGVCDMEGSGGYQQRNCPDVNKHGFKYKPGDIDPSWTSTFNGNPGEIIVFQSWVAERGKISIITDDTLFFDPPLRYPVGKHPEPSGFRYIVENIRTELDAEGEFFCDEANEKFYVIVSEGTFPSEDVYVATNSFAFRVMNEADDIEFSNLEFRHTHDRGDEGFNPRPAALDFENSNQIKITNCKFANLGYTAIHVTMCTNVEIADNDIEDVGYFGIVSEYPEIVENGGDHDNDPQATRNVFIERNKINGCGVINMLQPSCILAKGVRNIVVRHNEIFHVPYAGIRVGWQSTFILDHVTVDEKVFYVEENHIHNFGMEILNDFGGVYLASNPACAANERDLHTCHLHALVARNVIHASSCFEYGGLGVSADSAASSLEFADNWLYDLASSPINFNCGLNNKALNNMIYHGNDEAIFDVCAPKKTDSNEPQQTVTLMHNVVYVTEVSARMWRANDLWNGDVPHSDNNLYFFDPFSQTDYDVFFPNTMTIGVGQTLSAWRVESDNDQSSLVKIDPQFEDIASEDFRLKESSPAFDIGIRSVDLRGVREDATA